MIPPVAELTGVSHRYADVQALDEVDLRLEAGQVTALLGPNGAGKSTLIHLLLGLKPVQSGTIRLFGEQAPNARTCRSRIGTMLQASGVQDNLTVAELLALFGSFYPNPVDRDDLIEEAGLVGLENRRFGHLSGGQQQRALFALAAVGQPDWLILDEPTTGLDPAARRRLWQAVQVRRDAGASILLCTHYMDEAQRLADHVVVMNHGQVMHQGTPDEIRRRVPQDRIRVRSSLDEAAVRALPAVQHAERIEGGWALLSSNGADSVRALLVADPDASRLEVIGADLETAFLSLTETEPTSIKDAA
ncbi:ABC transporter ATP-binding protein [Wenzhouxiangella sp. XN79A]|uniref:ABC transporter ATP-binding protein n=1 Tax=Wenzhouxiangella sp. XN79A TaxID=2724193 RepID=UPI00144AD53A|nr:ABC transporter ATP-binding protein [Wenzhouxiangella sp. XN79A]NKI36121.1 ABC transporter ATP-binding protein [Wenzhouxiangella sp. XN79A]